MQQKKQPIKLSEISFPQFSESNFVEMTVLLKTLTSLQQYFANPYGIHTFPQKFFLL